MNASVPAVRSLDFRIIREGWSYYKGVNLPIEVWIRHVVTKIVEVDQKGADGRNLLLLKGSNISRCRGDETLHGPPLTTAVDPERLRRAPRVQVQMRPLREATDVYLALTSPARVVELRCLLGGVQLLRGIYDQTGEPAVEAQLSTVSPVVRDPFPGELESIQEDP